MKLERKALLLLPLAAAVSAAWADDGYTTLDTSVISAAGYAQDTREAPASVSVITAEELATKPIIDIGTAVGDVPGVDISQNKMGAAEISIRGFESGYTAILVDGRRMNTSRSMVNNGFDPGSVIMPPVGAIERIEVIRGPASTIWGSDAVGGVVNIITKKHPEKFTGSIQIERTQFEEDDKYGNRWGTNVYLGIPLKEDVLSLQLRGRWQDRDAYKLRKPNAPNGKNPYAGHSPTDGYTGNLGARLDLTVNDANSLYVDGDYTRYKGGAMNSSSKSVQTYRWWNKYNAVLGHQGKYDVGTLETYLQYNALEQVKTYGSSAQGAAPWTEQTGSPMMASRSWTFSSRLNTPLEFGALGSMTLASGVEAVYETFDDYTRKKSGVADPLNLDQTTLAAYAEGEYFVNENWIATLGGRVHWSDIFGAHLSPRAYLVYKPFEALSVKGGVANGYLTPQIKKLTDGIYSYGSRGSGDAYGNPDLKPEESWSWELSSTVELQNLASVTLGVFWTDFKNKLATETINAAGDTRDINRGKVRAKGVELLLTTAPFHGLRFTGGYTYTHAEILSGSLVDRGTGWEDSKRPNELPRHSLTARLDYQYQDFSAYVKSTSKFDSERQSTRGGANCDKYKNYTKIDIGATYVWQKNHHFSAALNNITDVGLEWVPDLSGNGYANAYKEYIDGRNLWLSYTYTF
ncbi:TonB-dependent receptor [uncultured Sutterella sp.]|uniref:TonB-dependent receptor domain-containing protein n=1 Tax=uncultured Sutterella sp. TaxID=286133 RepID=UPI0025D5ED81|nr:TonB-dependent receptor [uncultured Sutterella sp.]